METYNISLVDCRLHTRSVCILVMLRLLEFRVHLPCAPTQQKKELLFN
jgi:hypothetical protein